MEINITDKEIEILAEKLNIADKHINKSHIGNRDYDTDMGTMAVSNINFNLLFDKLKYMSIYDYARYRANLNYGSAISGIKFATLAQIQLVYFNIVKKFKELGYKFED